MTIDRRQATYGVRGRMVRFGDYQADGSDAEGCVADGAAVAVPAAYAAPSGAPYETVPDSTPLIPDNAAATLPSITKPPEQGVSFFDTFNCWVDRNPVLAVAGLAAVFFILRGRKKR